MPKTLKIFGLLFILFGLSSCIELVEEIKINSDLSGKYHLYVKHNGLEFLFNAIPNTINLTELETGLQKLKLQDGIRNLKTDINPRKGKFSIQFDFTNAKSLSHAFYASIGTKQHFYNKRFLKVKQSKIVRPNLTPYLIKYVESIGLLDQLPGDILEYFDYRYRLITPESIKSSSPSNASSKPNEYTQVYSMKTLLQEKQNTKSSIRLNK